MKELQLSIREESKRLGIDKIGFTTADPFYDLKERLKVQQEKSYASGFEKGTLRERTRPRELMPKARSIISVALAYPSKIKQPPRSSKEDRRGIFCRASWGEDYHFVLRRRLEALAAFIKSYEPNMTYEIMVDTGELVDGAVAERAGIGFTGKNTLLITEEFGSFVYLGEMLIDLPFEADEPLEMSCGSCRICIDVCPTGAITEEGALNSKQCLAFQTQQKHFIADEFKETIGTRVYGCDTCQAVCPYNKGIDFHHHKEFEPEPEIAKPSLKNMLKLSNRQFKDTFGHLSGAWRGKNPLQRNAIIGLAHYKDETAIPLLIELLHHDARPAIRGIAGWALGKIGTQAAKEAIEEALTHEKDEQAKKELLSGLSNIKKEVESK